MTPPPGDGVKYGRYRFLLALYILYFQNSGAEQLRKGEKKSQVPRTLHPFGFADIGETSGADPDIDPVFMGHPDPDSGK